MTSIVVGSLSCPFLSSMSVQLILHVCPYLYCLLIVVWDLFLFPFESCMKCIVWNSVNCHSTFFIYVGLCIMHPCTHACMYTTCMCASLWSLVALSIALKTCEILFKTVSDTKEHSVQPLLLRTDTCCSRLAECQR